MTSAIPFPPRPATLRRICALATSALLAVLLLPAVAARADDAHTLTVVGTSDVQDSGLIPNLVTPMFEKAFPQYKLNYVSVGTGVAINDAESGLASALLVHAASLENQFVAQGFSNEKFGRAIFYGDYVLLGPKSDPAGVLANSPHDIAGAFARIAAAGAAGKADFVSRGGTPGTTVQEHAIWALDSGTPGLTLCDVSGTNGGGEAPSTQSGPCPTTSSSPSWYHTTGLTQGPNIEAGNTCNFPNAGHNGNDCYVFTDRGTYECLISSSCAGAGSAAPTNLQIVTRDNSASAKGGSTLLVNSFHAYAINPNKFKGNPNVQLNTTAAEDFLNFITSPSFQAELKSYLGSTNDPPFIADAAPAITLSKGFPAKTKGGTKITVTGNIANLVPGTPPLSNEPVTVSEVGGGLAAGIPVASANTDSTGAFTITFKAPSTGSYQVTTGQIEKIENASLNPAFGDILQPGATASFKITVRGAVQGLSIKAVPGGVLATGSVLPGTSHVKGTVALLARHGNTGAFKKVASARLHSGQGKFALLAFGRPGPWSVKVRFSDPGQIVATMTGTKKVKVPARDRASVRTTSFSVSHGRFTLKGKLSPAPSSGEKVQLLALGAGPTQGSKKSIATALTAAGGVKLRVVATGTVKAGATTFTIQGKLRRKQFWEVGLRYAPGGSAGLAYGSLRTVRVP